MIANPLEPAGWDGQTAVILGHGAGQGMHSSFMNFFHQAIADQGYLSVKFDFEYMEHKRKVPDPQPKLRARYRQVIDEVTSEWRPRRMVIGGKSMGGRVASYIGGEFPIVAGLIFLGYPLHPPGKTGQLRDQHLYTLDRPMLFISGTRDSLAQRELLQSVVDRIGKRATLAWIEGGDHSLKVSRNDKTSLENAAKTIAEWIKAL